MEQNELNKERVFARLAVCRNLFEYLGPIQPIFFGEIAVHFYEKAGWPAC